VGPGVDVYALATVAYEALAGQKARDGRTPMEIAHKVATEPPPDLRGDWPEAPPAAAEALRRAMAHDAARRTGSAGELASELARGLERTPTAPTRRVPEPAPVTDSVPYRPAGRRRLPAALPIAAVLLAVAAVVAVAALSGGDDGENRARGGSAPPPAERDQDREGTGSPAEAQPTSGGGNAARGAQLNSQGYALMNQGRYEEAIPVLERAVESFPKGTTDLEYAYALYNLGRSLRLAGRADEAVPILERRLRIPNQTGQVRRELEQARRAGESG
jgi:tetratricopeptide (TPR) repeat protein